MPTQRITLDPQPPVQGKPLTICYDFAESGLSSTTLTVTFDVGTPASYEVSAQNPCVTIDVPANAANITVSDASGVSPDKVSMVTRP